MQQLHVAVSFPFPLFSVIGCIIILPIPRSWSCLFLIYFKFCCVCYFCITLFVVLSDWILATKFSAFFCQRPILCMTVLVQRLHRHLFNLPESGIFLPWPFCPFPLVFFSCLLPSFAVLSSAQSPFFQICFIIDSILRCNSFSNVPNAAEICFLLPFVSVFFCLVPMSTEFLLTSSYPIAARVFTWNQSSQLPIMPSRDLDKLGLYLRDPYKQAT